MRLDTALLCVLTGIGLTLAALGLYQILLTRGYMIAVDLLDAGWSARELRAHKKAALVLPWIQRSRDEATR